MDDIKYIILLTAAMAGFVLLIAGIFVGITMVTAGSVLLFGGLFSVASVFSSHGVWMPWRVMAPVLCFAILSTGLTIDAMKIWTLSNNFIMDITIMAAGMTAISPAIYMIHRDYIRRPKNGS